MDSTYVEEFLRSAILPRRVEDEFEIEVEDARYQFRQLANREIFASAHIDQRWIVLRN